MSQFEPGVLAQMETEQRAANSLNITWTSRLFCPAPELKSPALVSSPPNTKRLKLKRQYYSWLAEEIKHHDLLLLRHVPYDPLEWQFVRNLKKPILTVHHTLEGPEIRSRGGFINRVRATVDEFILTQVSQNAAGLVAVTPEIGEYERSRTGNQKKPSLVYPNGIFPSKEVLPDERSPIPELLFVASSFPPWQGLDRLVDSVKHSTAECKIHIVGVVPEELTTPLQSDSRFHTHGYLDSNQIKALSAQCTIGLSCLALERKGMVEACPLKVREYLALGLPVFGSYRESFPGSFPFYKQGAPKISEILDYSEQVSKTPRAIVRQNSLPFIDKSVLLKQLYGALSTTFDLPS